METKVRQEPTEEERLFFENIAMANVCANCGGKDPTIHLITFNKGTENEKTEFWCDECEAGL